MWDLLTNGWFFFSFLAFQEEPDLKDVPSEASVAVLPFLPTFS